MKHLTEALPEGEGTVYPFQFQPELKNEGFKTSSQVNYVARCGNFRLGEEKLEYTGALRILKLILSYDYLWQNLRVKGAYNEEDVVEGRRLWLHEWIWPFWRRLFCVLS